MRPCPERLDIFICYISKRPANYILVRVILSNADSYIVSVAISYEESGEHGYVDVKERGGDEDRIREELAKLQNVEIIAFRPSDDDKVLKFGK